MKTIVIVGGNKIDNFFRLRGYKVLRLERGTNKKEHWFLQISDIWTHYHYPAGNIHLTSLCNRMVNPDCGFNLGCGAVHINRT
jgi:hypothetical protein